MKKMVDNQNPQSKTIMMLFVILFIGAIIGLFVALGSLFFLQRRIGSIQEFRAVWYAFRTNFIFDTIIICMNLSLLSGLLWSYKKGYTKTQSPFLLGLVLFLLVLFVQSLLSLPILNLITSLIEIGAKQGFAYILLSYKSSIFGIIAHFFETVALVILFYLSQE
jgi:hypothetical protein